MQHRRAREPLLQAGRHPLLGLHRRRPGHLLQRVQQGRGADDQRHHRREHLERAAQEPAPLHRLLPGRRRARHRDRELRRQGGAAPHPRLRALALAAGRLPADRQHPHRRPRPAPSLRRRRPVQHLPEPGHRQRRAALLRQPRLRRRQVHPLRPALGLRAHARAGARLAQLPRRVRRGRLPGPLDEADRRPHPPRPLRRKLGRVRQRHQRSARRLRLQPERDPRPQRQRQHGDHLLAHDRRHPGLPGAELRLRGRHVLRPRHLPPGRVKPDERQHRHARLGRRLRLRALALAAAGDRPGLRRRHRPAQRPAAHRRPEERLEARPRLDHARDALRRRQEPPLPPDPGVLGAGRLVRPPVEDLLAVGRVPLSLLQRRLEDRPDLGVPGVPRAEREALVRLRPRQARPAAGLRGRHQRGELRRRHHPPLRPEPRHDGQQLPPDLELPGPLPGRLRAGEPVVHHLLVALRHLERQGRVWLHGLVEVLPLAVVAAHRQRKNFTEQFVLAEIYAQALEAAGIKTEKKLKA